MALKSKGKYCLILLILALSLMLNTVSDIGAGHVIAKSSIDSKSAKTDSDVQRIMENGLYKITDRDPKTIVMPASIPDDLMKKLDEDLNKRSHACSMVYVDLETGFTIKYNSERLFRGASLVKAPYMMIVLSKIKSGELSLDKTLTYTSKYNRTGTVTIPGDCSDGDTLSLKRVIEYLIYFSDNTAFAMMQVHALDLSTFRKQAEKQYKAEFYKKENNNWLNADGVAATFIDLYKKAKSGDELYVWFLELLKQANENKFIKAGIPTDENGESLYVVAHKYGEDVNSLNDAAFIFYGERPYLLILLNDYLSNSGRSTFPEVSEDIFNIHEYIVNYDKEHRND